jgi:hypothetical protein
MILEKKILPGNIQPSSSPKNKREKQKVRHKQTPNKDRTRYQHLEFRYLDAKIKLQSRTVRTICLPPLEPSNPITAGPDDSNIAEAQERPYICLKEGVNKSLKEIY